MLVILAGNVSADITNQQQAHQFLDQYCITLVNEIENAFEKQKSLADKGDWKLFLEAGGWIGGLSDEYSKLYKV
jgi:hypothetical protein